MHKWNFLINNEQLNIQIKTIPHKLHSESRKLSMRNPTIYEPQNYL